MKMARPIGWSTKQSAPGTPASRAGAASPTSIRRASGSRSSTPVTSSAIVPFPTSRSRRSFRWSPTSRSGTGSAAAMSSVIPTSRRPARKIPASCFPGALAKRRLALPSPTRDLVDPYWTDAGFLLALERFGYDVTDTQKAVIAFQRRFRPTSSTASSTANAGPSCSPCCCRARSDCRPRRVCARECSRMFVVTRPSNPPIPMEIHWERCNGFHPPAWITFQLL